jgi:hypothetical protein
MGLSKIAVAAATFASVTLLSFGWSGQHGFSLSIARAQAREQEQTRTKATESRAMPAKHVARHVARVSPRREGRIAGRTYGERRVARPYYGPNPVRAGADVAAGAVNTAGAVAAGAANAAGAVVGAATSPFNAYASGPYPGWDNGYYASSAWGDYECRPGSPGCQPYSAKGWK